MPASFTKKIALLMTSYIAITTTVLADNIVMEPFSPTVTPLTLTVKWVDKEGIEQAKENREIWSDRMEMESFDKEKASIKSLEESFIGDLQKNEDPSDILNKLKSKSENQATLLDKMIKAGLVSAGMAAGAGLAWFYGPALAYTIGYHTAFYGALLLSPNASWWTTIMVIHPAAIDTGVYCATSTLTQAVIGTTSSALGYGLGKVGCAMYDAAKYTAKVGINTITSAWGGLKNKFLG